MQFKNKRALLLAVMLTVWLAVQAFAGPMVVVDNPVYEFAPEPDGTKIQYAFIVKNAGDADLEIENIVPD